MYQSFLLTKRNYCGFLNVFVVANVDNPLFHISLDCFLVPGSGLDPVVLVLGALLVCCVTVIAVLIFYINMRRVCEHCKGMFTVFYFLLQLKSPQLNVLLLHLDVGPSLCRTMYCMYMFDSQTLFSLAQGKFLRVNV